MIAAKCRRCGSENAARIYGKVIRLFFPQNVTGHQENEAGRRHIWNVSAALCAGAAPIRSEKRFLSAVTVIFTESASEVLYRFAIGLIQSDLTTFEKLSNSAQMQTASGQWRIGIIDYYNSGLSV